MGKFVGSKMWILLLIFVAPRAHAQFVEFSIGTGPCSGFVGKVIRDSEKAYIFTAGHCIPGLPNNKNPNRIISTLPLVNPKKLIVRSSDTSAPQFLQVTEILFATFQGGDVAILALKESASDLRLRGIVPLIVQLSNTPLRTPIKVVNTLIGESAACFVEERPSRLTFQNWTWMSSSRLSSECKLGPGWSGAPVVNSDSGLVIGVLSGGNDSGTCDDYCETDELQNRLALRGRSYFSSLLFLSNCVADDGQIISEKCQP